MVHVSCMTLFQNFPSTFLYLVEFITPNQIFRWMVRDPRFLVCRALFLLTFFGWAGYAVGVTNHLSLKDVLLEANRNIDDDYEGATHSLRQNIDEADIALLHTYLRIALGVFMLMMAFFVLIGVCGSLLVAHFRHANCN